MKLLQQWMDGTLLGGSMDSVSNHVLISSFVVPNIALLLFIFAKLDLVDSGKVEDPKADYILDDPSSWMEVLPRPPKKKRSRKKKGSTETQEGEDTAEEPSGSYAVSYPGEGGSAAPATDGDAEVVRRTGAGLAVGPRIETHCKNARKFQEGAAEVTGASTFVKKLHSTWEKVKFYRLVTYQPRNYEDIWSMLKILPAMDEFLSSYVKKSRRDEKGEGSRFSGLCHPFQVPFSNSYRCAQVRMIDDRDRDGATEVVAAASRWPLRH